MLSELRSMEAMTCRRAGACRSTSRAGSAGSTRGTDAAGAPSRAAQARLKIEACRMFAAAGGSRANFERLWPSIFEGALKRSGTPKLKGCGCRRRLRRC